MSNNSQEANKIVIFGIGDYARIAATYLDADPRYEVVGFAVHSEFLSSDKLMGRPVHDYASLPTIFPPDKFSMLVAIGFSKVNRARRDLFLQVKARGYHCISYVSPDSHVWKDVSIGENSFIFEDNVVQPYAKIGSNTILWSGNHIGHDSTIGDHCFIASHVVVSGNCQVGNESFIGVNATIRDGITVAPRNVIGAGSIIMKDTTEGAVFSVRGTDPLEKHSWDLKSF